MDYLRDLVAATKAEEQGYLDPYKSAALGELRDRANKRGQTLAGYVEPILTIGSSVIAEPASGFVGLAGLPFGVDAAANGVRKTQEAMTYKPRTQSGQENLQRVGEALEPVAKSMEAPSKFLGDTTLKATGSPAAAAIAYSTPVAAMEGLGLKGARAAGKAGDLGKQYEFGGVGGQAMGQRGAVSGIDDVADGDWYYHTSPDEIKEITDKGKFGENLFFADEPYYMTQSKDAKIYKVKMSDSDIIDVDTIPYSVSDELSDAYTKKIESIADDLEWAFEEQGVDASDRFEFVENLISESDDAYDVFDNLDPEDVADLSWSIQRHTGDIAKILGYKAARGTDEQGSVIIAPMKGREKDLILEDI